MSQAHTRTHLIRAVDRLFQANLLQATFSARHVQRLEPKLGTTRRDGLDNAEGADVRCVSSYSAATATDLHLPSDVVANQAETRDPRVVLHDATERRLRVLSHTVCLVEDDDLERWRRVVSSTREHECQPAVPRVGIRDGAHGS